MKNTFKVIVLSILVLGTISTLACKKDKSSAEQYTLSVSPYRIVFEQAGDTSSITVTTDAAVWNLSTDADWLQISQMSGTKGSSVVEIIASEFTGANARSTVLTITAEGAETVKVTLTQNGGLYPSYNLNPLEPDASGMGSTAEELAANIKLGWNIGNTMEAIGGETAWGNPQISNELIALVKASGFNAIRIPCSWDQYVDNTATAEIKTDWLNRVKEVVQYCIDNDMYVLLNIHWDGGWLENNCTVEKQEENNAKQKAFWEQIATKLRDFDERLMFASANEPNVDDATQMAVLNSYHQTFVDAVRSTGGKNSYRVLVVQGPSTDIDKTKNLMKTLPTDEVSNKMMVEVHYYTPYQFCLMTEDASWGNMFYYWGADYHSTTDTDHNATWGEEADLDALITKMKAQFVDNGIPVVLGEFAAIRRTAPSGENLDLHLASRAYFLKYLTQQLKLNGLLPFYWDAGNMGENSSALFNRQSNSVYDQQALDALIEGITE